MGRTQALHPPAFLVDQHRRVIPTDAVAQLAHQIPHLIGSIHVAGEQDEAQRIDAGEKRRSSSLRVRPAQPKMAAAGMGLFADNHAPLATILQFATHLTGGLLAQRTSAQTPEHTLGAQIHLHHVGLQSP